MASGHSVVDVSEYTSALKRWWPMILVTGLAGAIAGLMLIKTQASVYESVARVEVRALVSAGDDPNLDVSRQVSMATEETIAGSQRVAERAAALRAAATELGVASLDDPAVTELASTITVDTDVVSNLQSTVEVESKFDSQILVFTASAQQAKRAQEKAESMAYAYIDFREEYASSSTIQSRQALDDRELEIYAILDDIESQIGQAGEDTARVSALTNRKTAMNQELLSIGAKRASLGVRTIDPGEVLDDAELPTEKAGIPPITGPVGGAMLGLFGGVGLAYLLDRRDDRIRNPGVELVEMGLPLLGTVPVGHGVFRRGSESAIASIDEDSAEQYRRVQTSLLFKLDQTDKSVVLIAGTNNPHSSTTVAANLAVAAARAGRRTLIIGADLRRPSLHDRFGASNQAGLSDVLTGRVQLASALQPIPDIRISASCRLAPWSTSRPACCRAKSLVALLRVSAASSI
ncbi:MAG: hypothetical protein R2706_16280 [Acidimicrobiales bacterium]